MGRHWRLPLCYGHLGRFGFKEPLLGCAGQAGLAGRLLKQVRKVSGVSLHPESHIFPEPESPLTSPCYSQILHPFPLPAFSCSSVTPLYPAPHCQQQSCISGSFKMCWCPLVSELVGAAVSMGRLVPSLHLIILVPVLCRWRQMPFIIDAGNGRKTCRLQDVRW